MRLRKIIACFVVGVMLFDNFYIKEAYAAGPQTLAEAYILIEAETGRVLRSNNPHQRIYPASMIKILSAILLTEYLDLDGVYIIGDEINQTPHGSSIVFHRVGEAVSGENLLRSIIMPSGNDSAMVVAMQVALAMTGDESMSMTRAEVLFADRMTQRARELGAVNSNFMNAHGFHHPNQFTTVYDLALIARHAVGNEDIMRMAGAQNFSGPSAVSDNPEHMIVHYGTHVWTTRNELILQGEHHFPYATGLRTGWNDQAGFSLIATATKDGVDLIAVISNSPLLVDEEGNETQARWSDARNLLEYGFDNFHHYTLDRGLLSFYRLALGGGTSGMYEVVGEDVTVFVRKGDENYIERNVVYYDAPFEIGEIIGSMLFYVHGEQIYARPLVVVNKNYIPASNQGENPNEYNEMSDQSRTSSFIRTVFSLRAIPFWFVGVALLLLVIYIKLKLAAHKRWRNDYSLSKRY